MMKTRYYKILYDKSIIMFYHDTEADSLRGMIEEIRTESKLTIQKHDTPLCYTRVSQNSAAQAMIEKAYEVSKEEYETAVLVAESMFGDSSFWLISDHEAPTKKEKVTAEVTIV